MHDIPRLLLRPPRLRPVGQQPLEQYHRRPLRHRGNQPLEDLHGVHVAPVVQDPAEEVDLGPREALLGEEVVRGELDPLSHSLLRVSHLAPSLRDHVGNILHDELGVHCRSREGEGGRADPAADVHDCRAGLVDFGPVEAADKVGEAPAVESTEPTRCQYQR